MASLAQYSATLQETVPQASARPAPSTGTRVVGAAIYATVFVLVAIAGMVQSAG